MKSKRNLICGSLIVVLVAAAAPALAQDTVQVRITNLSKQIISPPLVASHAWTSRVFVPGAAASSELALLAEDGDPSALATTLMADDGVLDVATAGGPLMPGATVVLEVESRGKFNRISAIGMLVTTNDAFFGLDNYLISNNSMNQRMYVPAWDAGTEFNNEDCDFIPGPPCSSPLARDTDGAEGFIHVHPGIQGGADLSPAMWGWQNPVVSILVVK
jgi:hypothetical protein